MATADGGFDAAAACFRERMKEAVPTFISWERGRALIVDNWRVLHGRAGGTGEDAGVRRLERVLVAESKT